MLITGTVAPRLELTAEGRLGGNPGSASSLKIKPDICRLPRVPALPLHSERINFGVT
jgi:hypothetical protein